MDSHSKHEISQLLKNNIYMYLYFRYPVSIYINTISTMFDMGLYKYMYK